jgi:hypothetical protein
MGTIQKHLPVKLITALTYDPELDIEAIVIKLEKGRSPVDLRSKVFDFSRFTPYYEKEMGRHLKKFFVTFSNLDAPEELPKLKIETNLLEEKYKVNKKRQVNIDPGYITQAKLVLATTKNYSHRIFLGQGIFGDVHMQYQNKSYRPQPWTYPDYRDKENIEFFNTARRRYLEQLADL